MMTDAADSELPTILAKILARKREEIAERRAVASEQTWLECVSTPKAETRSPQVCERKSRPAFTHSEVRSGP